MSSPPGGSTNNTTSLVASSQRPQPQTVCEGSTSDATTPRVEQSAHLVHCCGMNQNPLLDSLALERIERNLYRGRAPSEFGGTRIFGGHIIGQALNAAYATVEDRVCHSLHAYFIRPGDARVPILYE